VKSQLKRAVRAPPMCKKPVGEGAKRVLIFSIVFISLIFYSFIGLRSIFCQAAIPEKRQIILDKEMNL
jgi:hypothetical protein